MPEPEAHILTIFRPTDYKFNAAGNEDCLFVSVFAPSDSHELPVMVWIRKAFLPTEASLPTAGYTRAGQGGLECSPSARTLS